MDSSEKVCIGKGECSKCGTQGIALYVPQNSKEHEKAECFDCAFPNPSMGEGIRGMFNQFFSDDVPKKE